MNTWWCAIDREWSSYAECKQRGVVAQGWPGLGDLGTLLRLVPDAEDAFKRIVQDLGDVAYAHYPRWNELDRKPTRAPAVFWNLLNMRQGDLVIGLEGTKVRGVCQLVSDAVLSYSFDSRYHYAQGIEGVEWVDWDPAVFGFNPSAPAQGVHGIKRLAGESTKLVAAWREAGLTASPVVARWVNVDLPTCRCSLHAETCRYVSGMQRTALKGVRELLRDGGWLRFRDREQAVSFVRSFQEARGSYELKPCPLCDPA